MHQLATQPRVQKYSRQSARSAMLQNLVGVTSRCALTKVMCLGRQAIDARCWCKCPAPVRKPLWLVFMYPLVPSCRMESACCTRAHSLVTSPPVLSGTGEPWHSRDARVLQYKASSCISSVNVCSAPHFVCLPIDSSMSSLSTAAVQGLQGNTALLALLAKGRRIPVRMHVTHVCHAVVKESHMSRRPKQHVSAPICWNTCRAPTSVACSDAPPEQRQASPTQRLTRMLPSVGAKTPCTTTSSTRRSTFLVRVLLQDHCTALPAAPCDLASFPQAAWNQPHPHSPVATE